MTFAGLEISLPPDWEDITGELPSDAPPTLARCNGVGALQFSVAKCVSGPVPDIDDAELRRFLAEFGARRSLRIGGVRIGVGRSRFIVGAHDEGGELISVWYVTSGRDLALVTYVARVDGDGREQVVLGELDDAAGIVASIEFRP